MAYHLTDRLSQLRHSSVSDDRRLPRQHIFIALHPRCVVSGGCCYLTTILATQYFCELRVLLCSGRYIFNCVKSCRVDLWITAPVHPVPFPPPNTHQQHPPGIRDSEYAPDEVALGEEEEEFLLGFLGTVSPQI